MPAYTRQGAAAYVFTGSGSAWAQTAKLTAADGAAGDYFGYSLAIDGGTVVIAAPVPALPGTLGRARLRLRRVRLYMAPGGQADGLRRRGP